MKLEMSSFDIMAIINELQVITESRINKVFQTTTSELKINLKLRDSGRKDLLIVAGKRIHTTEYPKPSPQRPSNFAMTLRKYIGSAVVKGIRQIGFDRIIEITFKGMEGNTYYLIAELFGEGNMVLTDQDYRIISVMKPKRFTSRDLIGKSLYEFPPPRLNPFEVNPQEIMETVRESRGDLVRTLATKLGLGGIYGEEVCKRSGLPKDKTEISLEEGEMIFQAIHSLKDLLDKEPPGIIFKDGQPAGIAPFRLEIYQDLDFQEFANFNLVNDEYFSKYEIDLVESIQDEKYKKNFENLSHRLKQQAIILKDFILQEKLEKEIGDLIYMNFTQVEEILDTLQGARKKFSWEEIQEKIKESKEKSPHARVIKRILSHEGKIVLELDGKDVVFDFRKNVTENAEVYYQKGKKARGKIPGAKIAINNTIAKIKKLKEKGSAGMGGSTPMPMQKVTKKKEWFEKFRWFTSSEGFLVLGGRDATSNEMLVKKHMEPHDIFIHADIHGAPVVLIKTKGKEPGEITIQESSDFAATFSRGWKHNISHLEVYWVKPDQVSKTAESGESLAKGAFVVRGKRNFSTGMVGCTLGCKIEKGEAKIICGPRSAILSQTDKTIDLVPGRTKSKEIGKLAKERFKSLASEDELSLVESLDIEEIQVFLPPGTSEIKRG